MNDLLAQALAEVSKVSGGAVIREGQHHRRIPADQCRAQGPASGSALQRFEDRRIAAFWQFDRQFAVRAFFAVVARQLSPQTSCLHAHDGVIARVEGLGFTEDFDSDDELLEALPTAGNRLFDDKREEAFEAVRLAEGFAGKDPVELFGYLDVGIFGELGRGALQCHSVII